MEVAHDLDLEVGQTVEVVIEEERPTNEGWETIRRTDEGEVTAVPSRKFNWEGDDFDFDYTLKRSDGRDGATRSVSLDDETVRQLHYEAGGDRDWDTYDLISVTITGYSR